MHTDCELEPLRKEMTSLGINLNCASKKEHVPEIERFIRIVKERIRSARATMPFKRVSKIMIVHLVASAILGSMLSPHQHLVQDCQTQKAPDNLSLETQPTTKRFASSSQENMSKCIKKMNPETQLISTRLSAQFS